MQIILIKKLSRLKTFFTYQIKKENKRLQKIWMPTHNMLIRHQGAYKDSSNP